MEAIAGFIPPEPTPGLPVLARFLTPLPANVVAACIAAHSQPDELVINPFCRSATVAQEAVRVGRRALLSDANPLTAFVIRTSLSLPAVKDLAAGFQRLAEAPKGPFPLRSHLRQLYRSTCPHCQQPVIASHFVWSRDPERPVQKAYSCSTCGQARLEPVDEQENIALQTMEDRGFHFWSIMERLAPASDEMKSLAERLLGLYTPRNLYALGTLVNKAEAVLDSPPVLNAFRLVILECLDRASKLTPPNRKPSARAGLRPPAQFLEVNVWDAFEQAYQAVLTYAQQMAERFPDLRLVDDLESVAPRLLTLWSAAGSREGPAVVVRRGSAHRLGEELPAASAALILGEPPALVQGSYLPLSYLWTGWLLGKEAVQPFQPETLLHPRRHDDWPWYLQAMSATFGSLSQTLMPNGHVTLVFEDSDPGRVRALLLALSGCGLTLEQFHFQALPTAAALGAPPFGGTAGRYMVSFRKDLEAAPRSSVLDAEALAAQVRSASLQAAREVLTQRAQPLPFAWLNYAICFRLARSGLLTDLMRVKAEGFSPLECLDEQVRVALQQGTQRDLVQIPTKIEPPTEGEDEPGASGGTWETTTSEPSQSAEKPPAKDGGRPQPVAWWLARPSEGMVPLCDQVEETIYNMLGLSATFTTRQIVRAICDLFRGYQTPDAGLVEAVVQSYSVPLDDALRQLRSEDRLEKRAQEHLGLVCLLAELGHQLGFSVWIARNEQKRRMPQGLVSGLLTVQERYANPLAVVQGGTRAADIDVVWYGQGLYVFEVEWTARLQAPLVERRILNREARRFLVIPEERVDLINFKLARVLLWQQAVAQDGWGFIKSVHLRQFASDQPTLAGLDDIVGLAPPVEQHGLQLRLF